MTTAAHEIPKAYEPKSVEERWYSEWLKKAYFTANPNSSKPPYSIVIPPPNVTGVLTMGHVLNNTLQDILARRKRMQGCEVLWLPGTDHAGIATQAVVEKALKKQGVMRHRDDLGREKFLQKVWEWKEKHGGIIIQQLKKLGCSCDWTRERFTMDEAYSHCVLQVFVDLYKKGLIYRGKRMVNWCPVSLTALSDEEVIMKPQNGVLYYFKVEVAELPGTWLTIATTRPETIPGDTAIAVNPKDTRYARLIGKYAVRPLPAQIPREQKLIPIIGDEHVDFEFGTGVLKVTPAHDKADFDIMVRWVAKALDAKRRGEHLPVFEDVDIMNPDGTMNARAGESLVGLDRFEARTVAVEHLRQLNVLVKEEPYQNNVGFSERADVPIESRLSEQWFLKYPHATEARAAVMEAGDTGNAGRIHFHPERWAKVYDHWLANLQDWCISRQLWWGHRIPAWTGILTSKFFKAVPESVASQLKGKRLPEAISGPDAFQGNDALNQHVVVSLSGMVGHTTVFRYPTEHGDPLRRNKDGDEVSAATISDLEARELERLGFTQDPDVLDTWFSSWLWPFATMGWTGDKAKDAGNPTLNKFYPTTDLVTGPDIIFFWVARMIMAGYEYMDEKPFSNVYFTGIIRDAQGRKMSKSLGNSPDPLDLIAKYGADGLRFGLMLIAPQGQDILFDEKRCEVGRNFMNKLWNAARFIQMQRVASRTGVPPVQSGTIANGRDARSTTYSAHDLKILFEMNDAIAKVSAALDGYKFNEAAKELYDFVWGDFCDWYIEASKVSANIAVLDEVFNTILRLLHPFAPFITEELWIGTGGTGTIQFASWPEPREVAGATADLAARVNDIYDVVSAARQLRNEHGISPKTMVNFIIEEKNERFTTDDRLAIMRLIGNCQVAITDSHTAGADPSRVTNVATIFMMGAVDIETERARLTKQLAEIAKQLAATDAKLANANFVSKAAPIAVQRERDRQQQLREQHEKVNALLRALQ